MNTLFSNYSKDIIPQVNSTTPVDIKINLEVMYINSFVSIF